MPGIDKYFADGEPGNPGLGLLFPYFASDQKEAPTGYRRLFPKSTGWWDKIGTTATRLANLTDLTTRALLPAAIAYEDEANIFTLLNRFKDVQFDDQDGTPIADRRLRTIDGLIRAADTSNVEGRHISKASLELLDTVNYNDDSVSFAKMQNITGPAVIGKTGAGAGDPAEISAGADDRVMRRTGGVLDFGQLTVGMAPANVWTYSKIQQVSATDRFLGRKTAGAGDIEELTGTEATARLDAFTSALKGLAPASGGGTTNFLRADATWAVPPGGFTSPLTTRGDLLTRDGSTHIRLALGAARTLLRSDGTDPLWANPKDGDMDAGAEEFICSDPLPGTTATTQVLPWAVTVSGASAAVNFAREAAGHFGVVTFSTGTDTGGRANMMTSAAIALFGTNEIWCSFHFNINNLADATDDYELWIGFLDNTGAGDPVDGACVHYDRDTSANWQRMTANNSTITQNASGTTDGTAVAVATGWQVVLVRVTSSLASFYHKTEGGSWVFMGSESTNIPSASARNTGLGFKVDKEAGTTARFFDLDTVKLGGRI